MGSGDSFVKNLLNVMEGIDVFDMESYALAKVCSKFNVPFKCFKYITDNVNEKSSDDWKKNIANGILKFKKILNG